MLKKLIKNEFKENYKEMLILYGVSLLAFSLLGLAIRFNIENLMIIMMIPAIASGFSFEIFIIININRSFNKKLFSKEGYLTFSLPVKMSQMLFSKYLSNIIWMFASFIVFIFDVVFLLLFAGANGLDFFDLELQYTGYYLFLAFYILIYILVVSILLLTVILTILCFLNMGKVKKHKVLVGILMFYGFQTLLTFCMNFVIVIPYDITFNNHKIGFERIDYEFFGASSINVLFLMIIMTVGLIFLVKHLMEKKIELE